MLFGLFAFIWLPTPEVDASLQLKSPPDGVHANLPSVFRWTRSANSAVRSYRLKIARDQNMENVALDLPKAGNSIIAPQIAVISGLPASINRFTTYYWRVIALDKSGNPVEQSQEIFSFKVGGSGGVPTSTIISGLIKSDVNQLGLAGARVAVFGDLGERWKSHDNSAETVFNGEYIVIALTDFIDNTYCFPIKITSTKVGYQPTTIIFQESERQNYGPHNNMIYTITRNIMMIADFDGDGISDVVENASTCLDADDADTDNDGIADGDEDTNKNGVKDYGETDPCRPNIALPAIPPLLLGD